MTENFSETLSCLRANRQQARRASDLDLKDCVFEGLQSLSNICSRPSGCSSHQVPTENEKSGSNSNKYENPRACRKVNNTKNGMDEPAKFIRHLSTLLCSYSSQPIYLSSHFL